MAQQNKASFETQWEQILHYVDWYKIQKTMIALEWKWAIIGRSPNVREIQAEGKRLLEMAFTSGNQHNCGGFMAGNDEGVLWISFCITDWSFEPDNPKM